MMSKALICPYCGMEQYTHEPDDISAFMCLTECEDCGRSFWYSVEVTREYESRKDDADKPEGECRFTELDIKHVVNRTGLSRDECIRILTEWDRGQADVDDIIDEWMDAPDY